MKKSSVPQPLKSTVVHYLFILFLAWFGKKQSTRLEEDSKRGDVVAEETLLDIIAKYDFIESRFLQRFDCAVGFGAGKGSRFFSNELGIFLVFLIYISEISSHRFSFHGRNKDTVYGKKYDFASITGYEEFRARYPVTRFSQFEEYIERIKAGEENVLCAEKVKQLGTTSGTR